MIPSVRLFFLIFCLAVSSAQSTASVVINGTRVIYPSSEKEVTLRLENKGDKSSLVQVWIDQGDSSAKINQIAVPFIMLPPVSRIEPSQGQTLRISYTGDSLPQDRESIFWLNVLDIPPKAEKQIGNSIEMAFRSRIKLFYRPSGLNISSYDEQMNQLSWSTKPCGKTECVAINNPTPLFVTLSKLEAMSGDKVLASQTGSMIPPFSSETYPLRHYAGDNALFIEYINDFGSSVRVQIKHE
ncbi:fimbrial biogenesis chaperone [Dryocola sp. BD613]|uniref:fimbrial biogenesis chaperone n=1 Tax=Dryocola sp. BD613 TaxID=3133272 RepID=UPI003F508901